MIQETVKLVDQVSAPAGKAAKAVNELDHALDGLSSSGAAGAFSQIGDAAKGMFESFAGNLAANAVTGIISLAADAARTAVGLVKAGAEMAIHASDFRSNTMIAFEALTGSEQAAASLYEKALDLADKVGLEKDDAVAKIKALMSSGLGESQALAAVEAAANLAQVKGQAAAEAFTSLVEKIQAKGKLDATAIAGLTKQGVSAEAVYKVLEKQLGKTRSEVEALVKSGQIDATTGVQAMVTAINGGKIGELGAKAGKTFDRLLGDVKGNFERLFDKVDLSPLTKALSAVIEVLQGPAGEKLRAGIEKFFGGVFKIMEALFGGGTPEAAIEGMAAALDKAGDHAEKLAAGIDAIQRSIAFIGKVTGLTALGEAIDWASGKSTTFKAVVSAVWDAVGGIITSYLLGPISIVIQLIEVIGQLGEVYDRIAPSIASAFGSIGEFFAGLWETISGFVGQFVQAGADLVMGLAEGISGAAGAVLSAITGVVGDAISAAKSLLGISSPSKVFAGIGDNTAAGFAQGIDAGASGPAAAAADMALSAARSAANQNGPSLAPGIGGAQGGGGGPVNIIINLDAAASAQAAGSPQAAQANGQILGEAAAASYRRIMEAA